MVSASGTFYLFNSSIVQKPSVVYPNAIFLIALMLDPLKIIGSNLKSDCLRKLKNEKNIRKEKNLKKKKEELFCQRNNTL